MRDGNPCGCLCVSFGLTHLVLQFLCRTIHFKNRPRDHDRPRPTKGRGALAGDPCGRHPEGERAAQRPGQLGLGNHCTLQVTADARTSRGGHRSRSGCLTSHCFAVEVRRSALRIAVGGPHDRECSRGCVMHAAVCISNYIFYQGSNSLRVPFSLTDTVSISPPRALHTPVTAHTSRGSERRNRLNSTAVGTDP